MTDPSAATNEEPQPPGSSREQREVELIMVAALAAKLGTPLASRRVWLLDGAWIEVDGASDDLSVLCEAWAHQGPAKAAQQHKILKDALKLALAARVLGTAPRLILCSAMNVRRVSSAPAGRVWHFVSSESRLRWSRSRRVFANAYAKRRPVNTADREYSRAGGSLSLWPSWT